MQILQNSRFRLVACLIWCLCWPAIAVLLLTPLPFALIARSDLLGHLALFGAMTLAVVAFARSRAQIVALALLSIAYGVALEFAQAHVPGRTFDAADAMANALGGLLGCAGALILLERLVNRPLRRQTAASGTLSSDGSSPGRS